VATRKFILTESQSNELQAAFRHCQNASTKIRYQTVRLYGTGKSVTAILDICDCSRRSLMEWSSAYQSAGIAALTDHRRGGNRAKLKPHEIERIQHLLNRYTPAQLLGKDQAVGHGRSGPESGAFWNVADLTNLVKREFKTVFKSKVSYYTLLAKCEMSYQRPSKQYKSHSTAKLMAFEEGLEKKAVGHRAGCPGHRDPCRG